MHDGIFSFRSLVSVYYLHPPDERAIFQHNDLLCNGACFVTEGCIKYGGPKRKRSERRLQKRPYPIGLCHVAQTNPNLSKHILGQMNWNESSGIDQVRVFFFQHEPDVSVKLLIKRCNQVYNSSDHVLIYLRVVFKFACPSVRCTLMTYNFNCLVLMRLSTLKMRRFKSCDMIQRILQAK